MLRVGIDVRALQSTGGSAERGIGRYVTDLVLGLSEHSPEIHPVLFGLAGRRTPEPLAGLEIIGVEGPIFGEAPTPLLLKIPKLRSSSALWGRRHRKLRAELAAGMTRAVAGAQLDVLHFPTAVDVGSYPEGTFAVPQVRGFLDAIPYRLPEVYWNTWPEFMRAYYREQLAALREAKIIVAISHASAADAVELGGLDPARVRVVYPAVSDRYTRGPDDPPVVPTGRLTKGEYVLFCSVPDPHKNPAFAIRAFAAADLPPGWKLVFVSPGDHPNLPALRALAAELGLSDRFLVTGRVPESEMPALFAGAFALVSPSQIEGFGLPAAQAMASGTPVVASDRSALAEIVGEAGLLADPASPEAFARALRRLVDRPALRESLGTEGHRRAELFRPVRQARFLAEIYRDAAGRT